MAAVTLKDLMDPLTKIEKSAEQTNAKLDALIEMQTAGSGGGGLGVCRPEAENGDRQTM